MGRTPGFRRQDAAMTTAAATAIPANSAPSATSARSRSDLTPSHLLGGARDAVRKRGVMLGPAGPHSGQGRGEVRLEPLVFGLHRFHAFPGTTVHLAGSWLSGTSPMVRTQALAPPRSNRAVRSGMDAFDVPGQLPLRMILRTNLPMWPINGVGHGLAGCVAGN